MRMTIGVYIGFVYSFVFLGAWLFGFFECVGLWVVCVVGVGGVVRGLWGYL